MINAAVVGLGWWGQILARSVHEKSAKLRITRGMTRTPSKLARFSSETGIPVDDDFEALLKDPDLDALIIATPHSEHINQIKAAAAAGKHVFVEKPLALSAAEARDAFDACAEAGVVLAVGQNRRFLPAVQKLRELVADCALGQILHAEGQFSGPGGSGIRDGQSLWRASDEESPAGGMTSKGLHVTDLMIEFLGQPVEVSALSSRQVLDVPLDDTTAMLIKFAGGASAYMGTLSVTPADWRLQIYGTKAWAEIRDERFLTIRTVDGETTHFEFGEHDVERAELDRFAEAVTGDSKYPVTRLQAESNIALLEAIVVSNRKGKTVRIGNANNRISQAD